MDINHLKTKNTHERDSKIVFDEPKHEYHVSGKKMKTSVTTLVHSNFPGFNADQIIKKMMKSKNWENSRYYGMIADEIKDDWEKNRVESATLGTKMHKTIEMFYNSNLSMDDFVKDYDIELTPEFKMFMEYHKDHPFKPYRTEWEIYDEEHDLAGSVDMLYLNDDGSLDICDWKRSKEIRKRNEWENGRFPLQHLPNANYWHYSLQLNVYKYILESKYNMTIRNMFLVCLHPSHDSYQIHNVSVMEEETQEILNPI